MNGSDDRRPLIRVDVSTSSLHRGLSVIQSLRYQPQAQAQAGRRSRHPQSPASTLWGRQALNQDPSRTQAGLVLDSLLWAPRGLGVGVPTRQAPELGEVGSHSCRARPWGRWHVQGACFLSPNPSGLSLAAIS